jgi:hypothetical protein
MEDRDIIIYFTYGSGKLAVKTYSLDTDEQTKHKALSISNLNGIRDVKYSSVTNQIYFDVMTGTGSSLRDRIYNIDIMSNMSLYTSNKVITAMGLLNKQKGLVYQTSKDYIYIRGSRYTYKSYKAFHLLGVDVDDTIYLMPVDKPGSVLLVKDRKVVETKDLGSPDYSRVLDKHNDIYLFYSNYIYDLVNDTKIDINQGTSILDINGGYILSNSGSGGVSVKKVGL